MGAVLKQLEARRWPAEGELFIAASDERVIQGRAALHDLAQSVALVAGVIELLTLLPEGASGQDVLLGDLAAAKGRLVERTERLRAVLHEPAVGAA